jgi:hypothetical protein
MSKPITFLEAEILYCLVQPAKARKQMYEVLTCMEAVAKRRYREIPPLFQLDGSLLSGISHPADQRGHDPDRNARFISAEIQTPHCAQSSRILLKEVYQRLSMLTLVEIKPRESKASGIPRILETLRAVLNNSWI